MGKWFGTIAPGFNGRFCVAVAAAFGIFALIFASYIISSLTQDAVDLRQGHSIFHDARNKSHVDGSAFVFLALGAQANQMNCPAAVESLVRFSGWDGDVYIITDKAACFDTQLIVSNAKMKADKFHLVVLDKSFSSGGYDFKHPNIGFRKSRLASLEVKTELFKYIPDIKIHTIAYVDCDIIFTIPSCAQQFLQTGPPWSENKIRFSHVNRDNHGKLQDIHAGSFVVHREHSKEALELWHDQIELGLDSGDNNAFMRVYNRIQDEIENAPGKKGTDNHVKKTKSTTSSTPTAITPKRNKNPLEPGAITKGISNDFNRDNRNWFEKFIELELHKPFCMQHIPKARCQRYGRSRIQEYVNRFQLMTYDGGVQYCVSSWLMPLLYGWFPLDWIPYCLKFEKLL